MRQRFPKNFYASEPWNGLKVLRMRDGEGQTAPEGARLLCRAQRQTTEISHVLAYGFAHVSLKRQ